MGEAVIEGERSAGDGPLLFLDRPEDGAVVADGAVIGGWSLSTTPVRAVEVRLDGRVVGRAVLDGARPDVANAMPGWPGADRSGYSFRLDVGGSTPREAELAVVAEDGAGRRTEIRRRIWLRNEATPSPEELALQCDQPATGGAITLSSTIAGWAYSTVGVRRVEVGFPGQELSAATLEERPDVLAAHPSWSAAECTGFRFTLRDAPPGPWPREAVVRVVAEDRAGRRVEGRRVVTVVAPGVPPDGAIDIPFERDAWDPLRGAGWSDVLPVYGWAIDPAGVERIDVLIDGRVVAEAELDLPREDVELGRWAYRRLGLAARSGWQAAVPTEGIAPGRHELTATVRGGSGDLALGPVAVWVRGERVRADPERRSRLEAILRCPACGGGMTATTGGVACVACGRAVPRNGLGTLLFEETYAGLDWRAAGATSHSYPPDAAAIVAGRGDGLVLDLGAGLRENLPGVVQLDAIAYPTTDVSADAAALPVADGSFDGVIACNLLEHVAEPEAVVREIGRVCKPGGAVYADWTSVHPYHGFPHHYTNATVTGLDWLMRNVAGAEGTAGVTDNRLGVRMVLDAWLGAMENPDARASAERLPLGDVLALLKDPNRDPDLYAAWGEILAGGERLVPPKVVFAGVRRG